MGCCDLRRHLSLRQKAYFLALLLVIIIITASRLHCFSAALTVSAGSYFTLPDHQPLQLGVTVATVISFSAPSFPVGIGPPAVTCRKTSTPVRLHTQIHPVMVSHSNFTFMPNKIYKRLTKTSIYKTDISTQNKLSGLYILKTMQAMI